MCKTSKNDIKVGDRVTGKQLREIYGKYIIVKDITDIYDELGCLDYECTVSEISDKKLYLKEENTAIIYNNPVDAEEYLYE